MDQNRIKSITPLPNNEPPAVPSLWNTRYDEINQNFEALDVDLAAAEQEIREAAGNSGSLPERMTEISEALGLIQGEFGDIAGASAVSVQRAVNLDWLYRDSRVFFELWGPGFTMIDFSEVKILEGVSGDDSIDIEETENIKVGDFYVLHDAEGSVLTRVKSILSETRIRLHENLPRNFNTDAKISRCSMSVTPSVRAETVPGDMWLSKTINTGSNTSAVVIRRSLNSGQARLFYLDGDDQWVERGWSVRRQSEEIPRGFSDYEYSLPIGSETKLRLLIEDEPIVISHIVALGNPTGLGGFVNPEMRPEKPVISTPGDGAAGVNESPTISIQDYSSPGGTQQGGLRVQIAVDQEFSNVIHDSGELPAGLSYSLPGNILSTGVENFLRVSVMDASGLWSDWSDVTSFTTDISFAYVSTPSIVSPVNNAMDVLETPVIRTGPFSTKGGEDTHLASRYQLRASGGTWSSPVWDSGEDTENLLSIRVPAGKIKAGKKEYYLRALHVGTERGASEWSQEVRITSKQMFANIIGLAMTEAGKDGGEWTYVDESGKEILAPKSNFFDTHAVWGGIQDVRIDGQDMVKIPKFYVKYGTVNIVPYSNPLPTRWLSDQPLSGFHLYPAFKRNGAELDQIYIGKYQASMQGSKLASAPGVLPAVSRSQTQFIADALARNTNGVNGFMLWSVYQWSAIQYLYLLENATMNSQTKTGQGRVNASSAANVDASDVAQATYRGIVGLWGNVLQWMQGMKLESGVIHLWDMDGNESYINTGRKRVASGTTIYPNTFITVADTNYNFSDLFIGDDGPSSNVDATVPDYQYFNSGAGPYFPIVGGYWGHAAHAGLWCLHVRYAASHSSTYFGARLAKV